MHVDFVEGAVAVINGFLLLNQRFNRALQVNFFETHNPLVVGSSPPRPTKLHESLPSSSMAGFFFA